MNRTLIGAIVACAVLAIALFGPDARAIRNPTDFRAFYCAGEAIRTHHDPYRAEPLRACEVRETLAAGLPPYTKLAIPAPLPGYALLPFAVLSLLDFARASLLFLMLQIAAMAFVAWLLARKTGVSLVATFAALLLGGVIAVFNGQPFPIALAALCAAAFAAADGAYVRASICAACAAIEPHLALPAIASLAYALPRTRVPLAASLAVLAVASIATLGFATNLEYLAQVLPAHARSEAASGNQYSLTTVLIHLGVPIARALEIADVQYALFALAGIFVAQRLARAYEANDLLLFVPPLFACLGGPFIHQTQIAIAIPALFALAHRIPRYRIALGCALLLIAVPWPDVSDIDAGAGAAAIAVVGFAVAFGIFRPDYRAIVLALIGLFAIDFGLRAYRAHHPTTGSQPGPAIAAVAQPSRLAEDSWGAYERVKEDPDADIKLPVRSPTWIALALAIVTLLFAAVPRMRAAPQTFRRSRESPARE